MIEVDYSFYTNVYGGNLLEEEDFHRFIYKAYKEVNTSTYNRLKKLDKQGSLSGELLTAIKLCLCECAEVCSSFKDRAGKVLSSVKAGSTTEVYVTKGVSLTESAACNRVAEDYLSEYGLLTPIWG